MTLCTADFEDGTNGNNVTTGEAGSETSWDALDITSTGTIKYTNVSPYEGSLCMVADSGPSGGRAAPYWAASFGTLHEHYGRFFLLIAGAPPSDCQIAYFSTSGYDMKILLGTDRRLEWTNGISSFATVATQVPTGQYVRVEYHVVHQATGTVELRLWLTPGSSGAADDSATDTTHDTGDTSGGTDAAFGIQSAGIISYSLKLDAIVAGATDWPGPPGGGGGPTNIDPPEVMGTTEVGKVLTCDPGEWS